MTASSMNCTASVYHVWVRAVIGPALRRALAVWIGAGIVAAVIFGPTGMQPSDLTGLALHDLGAGAVIAATWLLLFVPTARIVVRADAATYLRSLPHRPTWPLAAAAVVALQLPWLALWLAGEGVRGLGVVGVLTIPAVLIAAWRPRKARVRTPRWRTGPTALAAVYARGLVRRGGDAVVRGAGLAVLAGLAGGLLVHNNHLTGVHAGVMASAAVAIVLVPATAGALLPLAHAHRDAATLAASLGLATRAPLAAVVAAVYVIAGAIAAAVVVAITGEVAAVPLVLMTALAIALMIAGKLGDNASKTIVRAIVSTAVAILWLGWLGATGAALAVVTGLVAVIA
jgi:hypothetical protein